MAITYNIAKCRGGWGVYVRAVSGDDLKFIAPNTELTVARVTSGRLARKRSKLAAKNFITRLQSETIENQRERLLHRCWIKVAPASYKVIRVQNLKLFRETNPGQFIPTFSTFNRIYAEDVALFYSERNKQSFLRKSVTKYLKLPLDTIDSTLNKI